jgi:tetratricopeptide (TPR) repeat protein
MRCLFTIRSKTGAVDAAEVRDSLSCPVLAEHDRHGLSQTTRELLNAEPKFPKQAVIKYNLACYFCQLGDLESAKKYLKRAFEIDPNWRLQALEDEDLEALWESL